MSHYFSPGQTPHAQREMQVEIWGRQVRVLTDSAVFSASRLDPGTAVLLDLAGEPPESGTALDLGCGWGPIALALALASPRLRVLATDVNERALALTAGNAARLGLANVEALPPAELLEREPDAGLDAIWSNPPIRVGKDALHAMLRTWLPRLSPAGVAHLVVSKNLGADSLHRWLEQELGLAVSRVGSRKGYRVLAITHP